LIIKLLFCTLEKYQFLAEKDYRGSEKFKVPSISVTKAFTCAKGLAKPKFSLYFSELPETEINGFLHELVQNLT